MCRLRFILSHALWQRALRVGDRRVSRIGISLNVCLQSRIRRAILLCILFLGLLPLQVSSSSTIMKTDPQDSYAAVGQICSVNVSIVDVVNLTGWQFKLYFKNSVLNCTGVSEGPFLSTSGSTLFSSTINSAFNSTFGVVSVYCSLKGANVSSSGSGVLATVTFKAIGEANSPLDLKETELVDDKFPPGTIPHLVIDGTIHVIGIHVAISIQPSNTSGPPGWININETFTVNVTVAMINDLAYWQVGMSFNPTVIECVSFLEGPFLSSVGSTVWQPGIIDNQAGLITPHGASLTSGGASGNGTLGFITFKVKNAGSSVLNLQDTLLLDSEYTTITPFSLNNGYFELPSEVPMPPTAYFFYYPSAPYAGEVITFNASDSKSNDGTIVSYLWSFGDSSQGNGVLVNHTFISAGQYNVSLTVMNSNNLTGNFSRIVNVALLPQGPAIDVYTQKGGVGSNQTSDSFAPDQLVAISIYVTNNYVPISGKIVTLDLYFPNGSLAWSRASQTDEAGIALIIYLIETAPTFGLYWFSAEANIGGTPVSDTCHFKVGWLLEILNMVTCDREGVPKSNFGHMEPLYVNVEVQNIRLQPMGGTITASVLDELGYQRLFFNCYKVFPVNNTTILLNLGSIPMQAVIGKANVTAFMSEYLGGVPYCPEKRHQFSIVYSYPDVAVTDLEASPLSTYVGHSVEVTLFLITEYYIPQSFGVSVYANNTLIAHILVHSLPPYEVTSFSLIWDTYHFSSGIYVLNARADVVPGEQDTNDNFFVGAVVMISTRTTEVHDVAITDFEASKTVVGTGYLLDMPFAVENQGDFSEPFNMTIYANGTEIAGFHDMTLPAGGNSAMTFSWNTTGFNKGLYILTATVETYSNDSDILDNVVVYEHIAVSLPGDINGDKFVNAKDAVLLGSAFSSQQGNPAFNPNADINNDGHCNAKDAVIVGIYFNQSWT
jgi:PKD repeat protein